MHTATALWITAPREAALRTEPLRAPQPGEVRVQTRYTALSRGTESLVYRHAVPASLRDVMRAPFQEGALPGPVKYGYIAVGVVDACPDGALEVGSPVFCLHPHQSAFVVPVSAVRPLPRGLPLRRALLTANLETALNGVWDGQVGPGDRVAVVGGGVVGALTAWLCARIPATRVTLIDTNPSRAELARSLGVRFGTQADDHDVVFEASGAAAGLRTALSLAATEARVVVLSWFGEGDVPAPLGAAFHPRRLQLRSSQVGRLPPSHAPRWTFVRRLETCLALLRQDALSEDVLGVLMDGETPLAHLPESLGSLLDRPGVLCHAITH